MNIVSPSVKHIVALSGGKDSTALALALAERDPRPYIYVCTPTGDELPEMEAHWSHLEGILGAPILRLRADMNLNELIEDFNALPNWRQRWCTRMLKIEVYLKWIGDNAPAISYVGLRADEEEREGTVYDDVIGVEQRFPLREWGWNEADVWAYLRTKNVNIPRRTDCARCYAQRLYEWQDLLNDYPDLYAEAEAQEAAIGHTFRSPSRDTWPAALADLRKEFESGRVPRRPKKRTQECRVCSL